MRFAIFAHAVREDWGPSAAASRRPRRRLSAAAAAGLRVPAARGIVPGRNDGRKVARAVPGIEPTVRKNFRDTAYWKATLLTNKDGVAEVTFPMPEQFDRLAEDQSVGGAGAGTKVGQGEVEVTTKKNLLLRLQAPRFFTQKDEVVLSANVHNYLKKEKDVSVSLEVEGGTLELMGSALQKVTIPAGGEKRVDWRVKVKAEGEAVVRMKAVTDEESDAMQMRFPSYVHGMLKMDSFSGVIRPEKTSGSVTMMVPAERRPAQTRLEVRRIRRLWPVRWWTRCRTWWNTRMAARSRRSTASCPPSSPSALFKG